MGSGGGGGLGGGGGRSIIRYTSLPLTLEKMPRFICHDYGIGGLVEWSGE